MKKLVLILTAALLMSICFTGCGKVSTGHGSDSQTESADQSGQDASDQNSDKQDSKETDEKKNKKTDSGKATILESEGDIEIIVPEGQESAGE